MSETSIRVKKGQRWRDETGRVHEVGDEQPDPRPKGEGPWFWAARTLRSYREDAWNNMTLLYDPDEGEAPEVGSRWVRDFDEEVYTVEAIAGFEGRPIARMSDAETNDPCDGWLLFSFRDDGVHSPASDSPSLDAYEAKARKLREHDERNACAVDGCDEPHSGTIGNAHHEWFACRWHKEVAFACNCLGQAVNGFVQRAAAKRAETAILRAQQDRKRAELLDHWMSLRPADLHEGGWRRVGVAMLANERAATRRTMGGKPRQGPRARRAG